MSEYVLKKVTQLRPGDVLRASGGTVLRVRVGEEFTFADVRYAEGGENTVNFLSRHEVHVRSFGGGS